MTAKQKALNRAAELGVNLEIGGGNHFELTITAPDGMVLNGTGCHQTVSATWDNDPASKAWESALDDMADGIEPCTDETLARRPHDRPQGQGRGQWSDTEPTTNANQKDHRRSKRRIPVRFQGLQIAQLGIGQWRVSKIAF